MYCSFAALLALQAAFPWSGSSVHGLSLRGCHRLGGCKKAVALISPPDGVTMEVKEKSSVKLEEQGDCMCEQGSFWFPRTKMCIKQKDWGYECGFFPREIWHRVCKDGLVCQELPTKEDHHVGYNGDSRGHPASCQECKKNCPKGAERHEQDCASGWKVTGEACATVEVTVPGLEASKEHTAEHTATEEASAEATATKTAEATATKEAEGKATAEGAATASAEADATAKASSGPAKVSVKETAKAEVTITKEATKTATAEATASASAEADGKATAKATEKATESSTKSATATATGVATGEGCAKAEEVVAKFEKGPSGQIGPKMAKAMQAEADEMALERAYDKALEDAIKNGLDKAGQEALKKAKEAALAAAKEKAQEAAE